MTNRPITFRRCLARAFTPAILFGAFLTFASAPDLSWDEPGDIPTITSTERLMDKADCWTGEAPADVEVPGHVLINTPTGPRVAGPAKVGQALEQIFDGADHNLDIVAFCR